MIQIYLNKYMIKLKYIYQINLFYICIFYIIIFSVIYIFVFNIKNLNYKNKFNMLKSIIDYSDINKIKS